jgi:hypothetical protein
MIMVKLDVYMCPTICTTARQIDTGTIESAGFELAFRVTIAYSGRQFLLEITSSE